jgi:hypothetical protein
VIDLAELRLKVRKILCANSVAEISLKRHGWLLNPCTAQHMTQHSTELNGLNMKPIAGSHRKPVLPTGTTHFQLRAQPCRQV